jgi:CRP-like cAMP-binding protein
LLGDYIYHKDYPSDKIYLICSGQVLMTWDEYENVPIGIFIEGNIFGDLEVYKNSKRLFSCFAITKLETFSMTKTEFRRILFMKYPTIGKIYLNIMDFKLLELEKVMQIIVSTIFEGNLTITNRKRFWDQRYQRTSFDGIQTSRRLNTT